MMSLKCIICASVFTLGLNGFLWSQDKPDRNIKQPNIIFIITDDLGYGDLGFNGQKHIKTPNIDRLAKEGMVFPNSYAGSTVCSPSRISLMLGKHTGHSPIRGNAGWTLGGKNTELSDTDLTVAEELKTAGYATAVIGKWGFGQNKNNLHPLSQGFDYFYGFADHGKAHHYYPEMIWENDKEIAIPANSEAGSKGVYIHDAFTRKAMEFIRDNHHRPFFLFLSWTIPHLELTVPGEDKQPYAQLGWPKHKMNKIAGGYQNDEEGNTTYAGMVSRMDRDLGRMMKQLKDLGIDEKTLVIFTSDNGPEYAGRSGNFFDSNGPFRGFKRDLYEGGIRVPFVARWPGNIQRGSSSGHLIAFWDFLPTACDLAGIKPGDPDIDGISFLPSMLGKKEQPKHEYFYWEFNEKQGPIQAIRKDKWKAVQLYRQSMELYDLSIDPGEASNLASQYPEIVAEMKQLFLKARTDHPAYPLIPLKMKKK